MGRLIDADELLDWIQNCWDWATVDGITSTTVLKQTMTDISQLPTVEAIPKADYEARLKADLVAMLTDIQLEIEEHEESIIGHYGKETKESDFPSHKIERNNGRKECVDLIQQKINELKAEIEPQESEG